MEACQLPPAPGVHSWMVYDGTHKMDGWFHGKLWPILWKFMIFHGYQHFLDTSNFGERLCFTPKNECAQWWPCQKPQIPWLRYSHLKPCWLATSVLEIHRTWHFAAVALAAPQQKSGALVCWCRMNLYEFLERSLDVVKLKRVGFYPQLQLWMSIFTTSW